MREEVEERVIDMAKIIDQVVTFTICFFVAQTLQFLGGWVCSLLVSHKSFSYFSPMSIVLSIAFALYILIKVNKAAK